MKLHLHYHTLHLKPRINKRQIVNYTLMGAAMGVADYSSFTLFFIVWPLGLLTATVISYFVALVCGYLLGRYWVFNQPKAKRHGFGTAWRYAVFILFNLFLTYAIIAVLEQAFGFNAYIGKLAAGFFMYFWIYFGDKYWVFKARPERAK